MLIIAAMLASAPPAPMQIMASDAFETFAHESDRLCPAEQLRFVTPDDLDERQEGFVASLSLPNRRRLAAADDGDRRCAGHDGLSCPVGETLKAREATRIIKRFAPVRMLAGRGEVIHTAIAAHKKDRYS